MADSLSNILDENKLTLSALKGLVDNSFDSILITDSSAYGKILFANKAFKALTGYSPAEVVGKTPRILQGTATDKKVLDRLRKSLTDGKRFEGRGNKLQEKWNALHHALACCACERWKKTPKSGSPSKEKALRLSKSYS